MSVLWLNSALAGLLGLAVVPLLAHLFARAKPKIVRFSSLKWLREVERRTARLQRPKDWLLAQVRPEAGDTASALRLAVEQAGLGQGARELYLISDFQATGWDGVELAVPPNMRVFKLKVAEEEAGNVSVASVTRRATRDRWRSPSGVRPPFLSGSPERRRASCQCPFPLLRMSFPQMTNDPRS